MREDDAVQAAVGKSRKLAARMPRLILEARRVASTVIHGLHGRRRAGPGENFWQYRRFVNGEPSHNVDWRRSARDDHLYVREREWEASHTIWLWADRSPSMDFTSALTEWSKLDRALVVSFALAEVLVQGGERVGIPELMRPTANRNVIEKMAQAIVHDTAERAEPAAEFRAGAVLGSAAAVRFLEPGRRVPPHHRPAGGQRRARPRRAGGRSGGRKLPLYRPHRVHRTGRPRQRHRRPRRNLAQRLPAPARQSPRGVARRMRAVRLELHRPSHRSRADRTACLRSMPAWAPARIRPTVSRRHAPANRRAPHDGLAVGSLPLGFAQPLVLLGLLSLPILWWLLRLVPPRPRRIDFPPTRLLFEIAPKEETPSRTPWWLDAAAADAGRAGHHRRRRSVVESAARHVEPRRAAADHARRRLGGGGLLGRAPAHRR